MKKWMISALAFLFSITVQAQCAMCRATLANNLSDGDLEVGSSINTGILYLFVAPYLAIGVTAFLWYKHSRANVRA